jgi:hypothetical protein
MPVDAFYAQVAAFFADAGWGRLSLTAIRDVAARIDAEEWAESDPDGTFDHPACHFSAGLFADFLGRVADNTLAVLEVECRSAGGTRCRFIAGSPEVMQHLYDRMATGADYATALDELG